MLDDFSTGSKANLLTVDALAAAHDARVQIVEADVRDPQAVRDAAEGCVAVVHLAAVPSVARSILDPDGTSSITLEGTTNVLQSAVEADVSRIVFASSWAVYGDTDSVPTTEAAAPRPQSPYAAAKLAAEQACVAAADDGLIVSTCLRFYNVYGPRQSRAAEYAGVVSRFMQATRAGEPVVVHGDGTQTRDLVFVHDAVDAIITALQRPMKGAQVLNVGTGRRTSLLEVLDYLEALTGHRLERRYEPVRVHHVHDSCANVGRIRWVLGWEALTSLADGLAATWEWFGEHQRR